LFLERLVYMALFSATFSIVGYFLPKVYFQYIDKTEYINIKQPVSSEFTEYKVGDNAGLIISTKSKADMAVKQSAKIVHVNGQQVSTQLSDGDTPDTIVLEKTKDYVVRKTNSLYIPCNAIPGTNYFQVIFEYEINGVDKTYSYISNTFQVLDEKSDRCK
jgi:hypothetical protein